MSSNKSFDKSMLGIVKFTLRGVYSVFFCKTGSLLCVAFSVACNDIWTVPALLLGYCATVLTQRPTWQLIFLPLLFVAGSVLLCPIYYDDDIYYEIHWHGLKKSLWPVWVDNRCPRGGIMAKLMFASDPFTCATTNHVAALSEGIIRYHSKSDVVWGTNCMREAASVLGTWPPVVSVGVFEQMYDTYFPVVPVTPRRHLSDISALSADRIITMTFVGILLGTVWRQCAAVARGVHNTSPGFSCATKYMISWVLGKFAVLFMVKLFVYRVPLMEERAFYFRTTWYVEHQAWAILLFSDPFVHYVFFCCMYKLIKMVLTTLAGPQIPVAVAVPVVVDGVPVGRGSTRTRSRGRSRGRSPGRTSR